MHHYKAALIPDLLQEEQNELERTVQEELGDVEPSQRSDSPTTIVVKWKIGSLELCLTNFSSPAVCFLTLVGTDKSQVSEYKERFESRLEIMSPEDVFDHARRDESSDIGWLQMAAVASLGGDEHHALDLIKAGLNSQLAQRRERAAEATTILGTEEAQKVLKAAWERENDSCVRATMEAYLPVSENNRTRAQHVKFRLLPDLDAVRDEYELVSKLKASIEPMGEAGYAFRKISEGYTDSDWLVIEWVPDDLTTQLVFSGSEDPPMAFIEVLSLEARINQQLTGYIERTVPTVTYTEALERARKRSSPVAWIVMAAATAPPEVDDKLLKIISDLLATDDAIERSDAGLALLYLPWPEARAILSKHTECEPDPDIRKQFQRWLRQSA